MKKRIKYEISEIGEVIGGATPSTKDEDNYGGDIPWITPKDLSSFKERYIYRGERNISEKGLNSCSAKLMPKNTVLFSSRAPIGYVAIAANELCTNQGFKSIIADETKINFLYLYYYLIYKKGEIEAVASGTTFKEVSGSVLKKFNIEIPESILEQKAIAATLSCLDDMIELNNRTNQVLEEIAQAIFKRWFVDFEFPNEDGEPYKSSGGEMVDSELGEIPKGWRIGNIGDYVKIKSGYAFKSSWWAKTGISVIKIKEIDNYTINFNDISCVADDKAELAKDFKVNSGDLLIAMTGATIGKFAIVPAISPYALVNQRVGKFFLGDRPLERLGFIYCTLKEDSIYSEIVSRGDGSAQPNISPSMIESIKIILPSSNTINSYNQQVMNLFKLIIENISENKLMNSIRDTLLPKLMSGEMRVPIEEVV